jgi:PleD family two-component response regulator
MESMHNASKIQERLPAFPSPPDQVLPMPTGKPRVLAVEDNHINMMLLTTYLKKNGFSFDKAIDGLQALEKVRSSNHAYDVILMDLRELPSLPVLFFYIC